MRRQKVWEALADETAKMSTSKATLPKAECTGSGHLKSRWQNDLGKKSVLGRRTAYLAFSVSLRRSQSIEVAER